MNQTFHYSNQKLTSLQELIGCVHPMYFTIYDGCSLEMLSSNAPNADIVSALLAIDNITPQTNVTDAAQLLTPQSAASQRLIGKRKKPFEQRAPMICSNSIGMLWISDLEYADGKNALIHVMGPAFTDDFSVSKIETRLNHLQISLTLKQHFLATIKQLPILPMQQLLQYAIMLHYSLTGETLTIENLFRSIPQDLSREELPIMESHRSTDYMFEQQLLSCVREGNLSYQSSLEHLAVYSRSGKLADHDYLRNAKNLQISFTALCTRAAIEGGLSPDSAYLLSDHYIQKIEASDSIPLLGSLGHSMLEDFIQRVHRIKANRISPPIQKICDRIQLHPETKTNIHTIAEEMGYSDYYLSKKFKQEMGCSISEYATAQKIEKAKQLLTGTRMTIGQIADALNLCSQSYFGNLFFKHMGMTPMEYRNRSDS